MNIGDNRQKFQEQIKDQISRLEADIVRLQYELEEKSRQIEALREQIL